MGMALIESVAGKYDCIWVHYRTMNSRLQDLKKRLGDKLILVWADLSDEAETHRMIEQIRTDGRTPDHIVHFAAPLIRNQRFPKTQWSEWQNEIDISLRSVVLTSQEFLPLMAKKHEGRVVFMLSNVVSGVAPAYCSNYVVAKYALLGLMRSLASEYADKGITVNAVSPGHAETKFLEKQPDVLRRQWVEESSIGRNLEPEDIIPSIAFLLSDGSACVNGENIVINCGR